MFDLYVGSQVEMVDKDKLTLTREKLSLALHAGLNQTLLCVSDFLNVCLTLTAVVFRSFTVWFSYILA